jgi:hypothetical protein
MMVDICMSTVWKKLMNQDKMTLLLKKEMRTKVTLPNFLQALSQQVIDLMTINCLLGSIN